jgi:hypothetical protein
MNQLGSWVSGRAVMLLSEGEEGKERKPKERDVNVGTINLV